MRRYNAEEAIVFLRTKEPFGGLSNMAAGFPLRVGSLDIPTSEALYQACRFPHLPDLQASIIGARSPMSAKDTSRAATDRTRPDWDRVRVALMRWVLRVKYACSPVAFGRLLRSTGKKPVVERSARGDIFWGAVSENGVLVGRNVLGRLLMELREELACAAIDAVRPPPVPRLLLLGEPASVVDVPTQDLVSPSSSQQALLGTDLQAHR